MGDTARVNPLLWLALPVVITVLAAVIVWRREHRVAPDDDARLARVTRALRQEAGVDD
jgi:cytochrome c-type biogenesis protein CcmH/NrfF